MLVMRKDVDKHRLLSVNYMEDKTIHFEMSLFAYNREFINSFCPPLCVFAGIGALVAVAYPIKLKRSSFAPTMEEMVLSCGALTVRKQTPLCSRTATQVGLLRCNVSEIGPPIPLGAGAAGIARIVHQWFSFKGGHILPFPIFAGMVVPNIVSDMLIPS